MRADEVYKVLKRHPNRWFTLKELQTLLNFSKTSIRRAVRNLWLRGMIEKRYAPLNFSKPFTLMVKVRRWKK